MTDLWGNEPPPKVRKVPQPKWYVVPAGTRMTPCRSCEVECFWTRTEHDKAILVNCDVDGASRPTKRADGLGRPHFEDCPHAKDWKGRTGHRA